MKGIKLLFYFIISSLSILVSCGTPHTEKLNNSNVKTAEQILGDSNYLAICYGGYRATSREVQPTVLQIKDDMKILSAMGIKIVRTYNTKFDEIRNLLKAIDELKKEDANFEMYVMLGVWIECENAWTTKPLNHNKENEIGNSEEIARAVELANAYPEIVKIIAVGNEAMVHWAEAYYVHPSIVLKWVNYLQALKAEAKLPKDVWISSSDNYASWGGGDSTYKLEDLEKLYKAVDYVSIHTYPMHDTHYNPAFWGINLNEKKLSKEEQIDSLMYRALYYAQSQYKNVQAYMKSLNLNKPIHIGETGWASSSDGFYGNEGSMACDEYKSAKYYELMRAWTNKENISCFYFEAFDEHWKDAQNPNGSENHFGLFTTDAKAKFANWSNVDKGNFKDLKRDGNSIRKTYDGKRNKVLQGIQIPEKIN